MDTVDFPKAKTGEAAHVYVCPPEWEFSFVTEPDYFTNSDETETIKRQTWQLLEEHTVVFHSSTELCPECHGEGVIQVPISQDDDGNWDVEETECEFCAGDGRHPRAGETEVVK